MEALASFVLEKVGIDFNSSDERAGIIDVRRMIAKEFDVQLPVDRRKKRRGGH